MESAAITIPSPTWACFWQLIFNSLLPLNCIQERWPDNKGKVHKLLWIKWLGPLWPTGFGSITAHNLLFSSFSYKQPFQKKNELGTSSAAMFSHYTAIKIKHKCYQIFCSPSHTNAACVFFSWTLINFTFKQTCTGFFFIQALS